MPIKGLTTPNENEPLNLTRALPEYVRLFKGNPMRDYRRKDGRMIKIAGEDLDYFRVEFPAEFEHLRPIWNDLYGEQPDRIGPVFLAAATVDEAFSTWNEEWTRTRLVRRCDGETIIRWYDVQGQCYSDESRPCMADSERGCKCKRTGRLNLLLPDFTAATGVFGYCRLNTHSFYDIRDLHRYLTWAEKSLGTLKGVPFELGRRMQEVTFTNEDGERMVVEKSLLYMQIDPDFTQTIVLPRLMTYNAPDPDVEPVQLERQPRHLALPDGQGEAESAEEGIDLTPYKRRDTKQRELPTAPADESADESADEPTGGDKRSQGKTDWTRPPASNLVPAIRKAADVKPAELFPALAELGDQVNPDMDAERIAELVVAHLTGALDLGGEVAEPEPDDVVDGEFEDVPEDWPAELAEEGITPDSFKLRQSPIAAGVLWDVIHHSSVLSSGLTGPVPAAQKKKLAGLFNEAVGQGKKAHREAMINDVIGFLFAKESLAAVTQAESVALFAWLTDTDKNLHPCAHDEIVGILELVLAAEEGDPEGVAKPADD